MGLAIKAWKTVGWKFIINVHTYTAFPVLFLVFIVALGGITTKGLLNGTKWNTKLALRIKLVHKTFAYLILLSGFVAIAAGIHSYRGNPKHFSDFPVEYLHVSSFLLVLSILEYNH
jgi:hypothetical protein